MKYFALVLNGVAIVVLGWGLGGVVDLLGDKTRQVAPLALPEMRPITQDALAAQQETVAALEKISAVDGARAPAQDQAGAHLVTLPPAGAPGSDGPQLPSRHLNLLARMANEEVAVIDGNIVRKGQLLPQGGRVLHIKPSQVTVQETKGKQDLKVDIGGLRVGTLRWGTPLPQDALPISNESTKP
ncbi:MAG: hypothetical protein PHS32_05240 [Rhodoferax sp.]|uniref:hypothetical protein n=1 Tax=Rhodoferax sp. TaxID=50421 RepID=UPI0026032937|nr:hypothetical protein [Rhodoferax sp.]MDD5333132.1 hypothetical protein [Rhodoferax sp.]